MPTNKTFQKLKNLTRKLSYFLLFLFLVGNLFILLSGRFYLYKGIYYTYLHGKSGPTLYDEDVFANRFIANDDLFIEDLTLSEGYNSYQFSALDEDSLRDIETASFLVYENNKLVFESYWDEHNRQKLGNSFSVSKTVVGLLIGAAIQDGYIKSIEEPIAKYLPFIEQDNAVKIKHLLWMASGLDWTESGSDPLSKNAEAYYTGKLDELLACSQFKDAPGEKFEYKSGNSQLLGMILKNATGKSVASYAQEKFWTQLGMESDAFWSLDNKDGSEKSFCCLYATSRDFLKLGKLILNKGRHKEKQIIPEDFISQMMMNPEISNDGLPNKAYGMHIWTLNGEVKTVYARGILGQYIIVQPEKNRIIVRTGSQRREKYQIDKKDTSNYYLHDHPKDLFLYLRLAQEICDKQ
ncbi:CubicO group peptidase, beta-lactamase class C family [Lishizhenia tianjinensis]|uniref:CubicO group peptidase, beta-lactamase class C family n=1 Tax=Lishizhenia tianjinensis TaxID=477690 RepID=A0A1I7B3N3_9FLAO|nr:serine hydrolase [Lishizhenia tianjinensis]SFT81751.1 CubicO group peptidase, beta-lactamase class C family [Lishizhenia tianjinensis]